MLGAPCLPHAEITLDNGHTLEVTAHGLSARNRYVKSVKLNGIPVNRLYLTHEELLEGGTLEYEMAPKPNKRRGIATDTKPYSL